MNPEFYQKVAQQILSSHAEATPDLRGITVVLPNYHVAQPLARALITESGLSAVLLPDMLTLGDWAASVPLDISVDTDNQRIALLYQTLRDQKWFEHADLWSLARELLSLIDELTRHYVALPESQQAFTEQLVAAYAARNGYSLQFEARVVHELWYAMAANSQSDGVRQYQQRLAHLAEHITTPLFVMLSADLSVPEQHFLQRCGERVTVTRCDLRELIVANESCAVLRLALCRDTTEGELLADAQQLKQEKGVSYVPRVRLFAAHGMEQEARAAEVQIRRYLLAGKRSIAVVVQDRLVARRVRALLERAQVQVQDESGWTFATLSVSTVLMGWLETLQNDFYHRDVLDLLKSPFLFADAPAEERKQAAYEFEQMVSKHNVVGALENYLATSTDAVLNRALVRLRQAAAVLPKKNATLSQWLLALRNSLKVLGVLRAWSEDAAGQQLLQLLGQWREELQQDGTRCSFAEWKRWLSQQLDLNTFRDMSVESPVIFTHLAATRWRSFDAVVLLGCDAQHLPAPASSVWFNDAVRAALDLPMSKVQQDAVRDDLLGLLALNDDVLVTWQAHKNGEPHLLSPYFEMLRALHVLAFGETMAASALARVIDGAVVRDAGMVLPPQAVMPLPSAHSDALPMRISPSAYNSLVACPYQFYARYVLRLNELDEVREEIDKRDYGTWVHQILQNFHGEYSLLSGQDVAALSAALQRISSGVFEQALQRDYQARAWLVRWQKSIPSYIEWQLAREASGWHYENAEVPFEVLVAEGLTLRGRIDRVDVNEQGAKAVLDYKTQSSSVLKKKLLEPGEDVQLSCYAQVSAATEAAFVSLEGKVQAVAPADDVTELAHLDLQRLQHVYSLLRDGQAMPAHGAETVCTHCEMRGLCRQGVWEETHG